TVLPFTLMSTYSAAPRDLPPFPTRRSSDLEALGERLRLVGVLGQQKPQRILGVVDASGRVQARTEHEADVPRPDPSELQTGALDERAHTKDRRAVQSLEPELCEDTVASAKRDDVG